MSRSVTSRRRRASKSSASCATRDCSTSSLSHSISISSFIYDYTLASALPSQRMQANDAKTNSVQFVKTDVTSWPALVDLFKAAISFSPHRTVDIVIPNAGVAGPSLAHWLMDTPKDDLGDPLAPPSRVVDVNYMAVFNTVHAAMDFFKAFPGSAPFPAGSVGHEGKPTKAITL